MESDPQPPLDALSVSVSDSHVVFDLDHPSLKTTEHGICAIDRRSGKLVTKFQDMPGSPPPFIPSSLLQAAQFPRSPLSPRGQATFP